MATNRASTVHDIQVNAAATVLAECGHYALQQAWGGPAVNWHSLDANRKQTLIEHAAWFLERLRPIAKRRTLAMVKAPAPSLANSGDDRGEGEKPCSASGGESSGDSLTPTCTPRVGLGHRVDRTVEDSVAFLIDPEPCLYCGCAIEDDRRDDLFCCDLCATGWAKESN